MYRKNVALISETPGAVPSTPFTPSQEAAMTNAQEAVYGDANPDENANPDADEGAEAIWGEVV